MPGPSLKHLYVENVPHLPGGFSRHLSNKLGGSKHSVDLKKLRIAQLEPTHPILSVADKYNYMRETFRRKLAYGKLSASSILIFFCSIV